MSFHYHDNDHFMVGCGASCSSIKLPEITLTEKKTKDGVTKKYQLLKVKQNRKLPSPDTTDLKRLLDAGAKLEKVDTRMFDSGEVVSNLNGMLQEYNMQKLKEEMKKNKESESAPAPVPAPVPAPAPAPVPTPNNEVK